MSGHGVRRQHVHARFIINMHVTIDRSARRRILHAEVKKAGGKNIVLEMVPWP
jgi:macrodomain Ter protein organizer (MatP/YcbG family)